MVIIIQLWVDYTLLQINKIKFNGKNSYQVIKKTFAELLKEHFIVTFK